MISPQVSGPLYSDDHPGHALAGWAAVWAHGKVVVAAADTGLLLVALDSCLTGLRAVPPQGFLQDVMADGRAQVPPHRAVDRQ